MQEKFSRTVLGSFMYLTARTRPEFATAAAFLKSFKMIRLRGLEDKCNASSSVSLGRLTVFFSVMNSGDAPSFVPTVMRTGCEIFRIDVLGLATFCTLTVVQLRGTHNFSRQQHGLPPKLNVLLYKCVPVRFVGCKTLSEIYDSVR